MVVPPALGYDFSMCPVHETFFDSQGSVFSVPTSRWEEFRDLFEISDLRSMSRASVVLRGLVDRQKLTLPPMKLDPFKMGIYVLGEENDDADFDPKEEFAIGEPEGIDAWRKIPAKSALGRTISMSAAQIGISTGARGPVIGADFNAAGMEFVLDEIAADFETHVIESFYLGGFVGSRCEAAYLAFGNIWDDTVRTRLERNLSRMLKR